MIGSANNRPLRIAVLALAIGALSGCNALNRLSEVGRSPNTSVVSNPTQEPGYRPVSLPMPSPTIATPSPNSLWRPGARAFFKDQRAKDVGDILTVTVSIDEKASLSNETERKRTNTEGANLTNFLGLEAELSRVLPQAINPAAVTNFGSSNDNKGTGTSVRSEQIKLNLAAVIIQILPNGNLVIAGRQEVAVNFELRELRVTGIIRPEDIKSDNTIPHDKIAEARVTYGGRGQLMDVQQPRYGAQIYDILFPF